MNDWQKIGRALRGTEKGDVRFVVLKSRTGTGKSMYAQNAIQIGFTNSWTKWEEVWSWKFQTSSRSNKILWGRIMMRENKFLFHHKGKVVEYASPKEALSQQREEFKRVLS